MQKVVLSTPKSLNWSSICFITNVKFLLHLHSFISLIVLYSLFECLFHPIFLVNEYSNLLFTFQLGYHKETFFVKEA